MSGGIKAFVKRVARGIRLRDRYRTPKPHSHVCRRCGHLFRGCHHGICLAGILHQRYSLDFWVVLE